MCLYPVDGSEVVRSRTRHDVCQCSDSSYSQSTPVAKATAPLLTLNDGHTMPSLSFGTWLEHTVQSLGDTNFPNLLPLSNNSMKEAVEAAIDTGYRFIDTAPIYFTEEQVGEAVNNKIAEGVVKREDLFIATKLWNDKHATEDVVPALRESLARLKMEYVDLYLIHWPISTDLLGKVTDVDYLETWKGMIEAKRLGLAKSIGVANFNQPQLQRLLKNADVKPAVLQIEVNLNIQQACLREFAKKHDIKIMGYTPFGSLFPGKATPLSPPPRYSDAALVAAAGNYGKTVTQLNLRYLYELGVVPIPKSEKKTHIEQNFDIFDFELKEEDKEKLEEYDRNFKTLNIAFWRESPYYPW